MKTPWSFFTAYYLEWQYLAASYRIGDIDAEEYFGFLRRKDSAFMLSAVTAVLFMLANTTVGLPWGLLAVLIADFALLFFACTFVKSNFQHFCCIVGWHILNGLLVYLVFIREF